MSGWRDLFSMTIHWFSAWFTTRTIHLDLSICRDTNVSLKVYRDANFVLNIDRTKPSDMGV